MPKETRNIRRNIRKRVQEEIKPFEFPAILGNRYGVVLTGVPSIVYITTWQGQTISVLNKRVPNDWGRPVKVGYDKAEPGVLQVLAARNVFGKEDLRPDVPEHASTHDYGGGDTDFVRASRFMYLLVLPYSGFTVQVFGGAVVMLDGTIAIVQNQTLDLSSYQPATGALWALIEVDSDGSLSVTTGSTVAQKGALTVADIPTTTQMAICAIKLYSSQTSIQRSPTGVNDFIDLRFSTILGIFSENLILAPDVIANIPSAGVPGRWFFATDEGLMYRDNGSTWVSMKPDADNVTFSPSYLADYWKGYLTDPDTVATALDELVERLTIVESASAGDASAVSYTPDLLADWDYLTDPGNVDMALDQLAARVTDTEAASGSSGGAYQRVLTSNLSLVDGECLVLTGYLDLDNYILTLDGDSRLEIL